MKKHKEDLHKDYTATKVLSYMKTSLANGIILKVRFYKTSNLSFLEWIQFWVLALPKRKDVYFWLPFRHVLDSSSKYSAIGPAKRYPYSNTWFQVKQDSEIYTQGLYDFVFKRGKVYKAANEMRMSQIIFTAKELTTVTCKSSIRFLDNYAFKQIKQHRKAKYSINQKM